MTERSPREPSRITVVGITITNIASLVAAVYYVGVWTSDVKSEQRHTTDALNALQAVVYTKGEAQGDKRVVEVQLDSLTRRVSVLEDRRVAKVRVTE